MSKAKIGVVDVGGGYRGIYAAGVLDYCMDNGIRFDTGIGVSAGSANLISFVCHPYAVGNKLYYDGALSDPIPLDKAFEMGCERVVLILTLPEDTVRTSARDRRLAAGIHRKYPLAAQRLEQRAQLYNEGVATAGRLRMALPHRQARHLLDTAKKEHYYSFKAVNSAPPGSGVPRRKVPKTLEGSR